MSTVRCPGCGHENPADVRECEACGFPLVEGEPAVPAAKPAPDERSPAPAERPAPRPVTPGAGRPSPVQRPLPVRRRRVPRRADPTSTTLWIVFGGFAAMVVLWVAVQATLKRNASAPVEGSNASQQAYADSLLHVLEHDSTNVDARQHLADLYYDTANWDQAVTHYKAVLRTDSTRTTALVDMGVCYFNMGDKPSAEAAFTNALSQVPNHPVALFNLGIVYESRDQYAKALEYFHRALQSNPPEDMHTPLVQAIQRLQQKTGVQAPPLGQGTAGSTPQGR